MAKAILTSIKPEWCALIASGEKTIEVRKTRPKLDPPFKYYIYCCKPKKKLRYVWTKEDYKGLIDEKVYEETPDNYKVFCKLPEAYTAFHCSPYSGKVIGEFVCREIQPLQIFYSDTNIEFSKNITIPQTCLTDKQIIDYLGNGKLGYGYYISGLVIYDEPKELNEFHKGGFLSFDDWYNKLCIDDERALLDYEIYENNFRLNRPPQSWCYVEELK